MLACWSGDSPKTTLYTGEDESEELPDDSDFIIVSSLGDGSIKMKSSFVIISTIRFFWILSRFSTTSCL
jgi:hypothetical protein